MNISSDKDNVYLLLFDLIKQNNWDKFKEHILLSNDDFDINIRDKQNNYFLTFAILHNRIDIIKLLLDKNAKIDILDQEERSILYLPIKYGYNEILELLLNTNKNNIGISIIDLKDKTHKIPLHQAIILKNITAINLLLKYGSNVNIFDNYGYNSLYYAVYSRKIEIFNIILPYITDINYKCITGETVLHIACNLQLIDIVAILLNNYTNIINVNIQDYEHEFGALHYTVNLNNIEILNLLIMQKSLNPNIQDNYGNTPLHYAVMEQNYEIIDILIKLPNINFNLWNITGDIPLHIFLENYQVSSNYDLSFMLEKSNLNIKNNFGNTCLYYLIKINMWQNYKNILINKKLDIFIQNKKYIRIIDMINSDNKTEFINIITSSYYNKLIQKSNNIWLEDWENKCSTQKTDKNSCLNIINKHLQMLINKSETKLKSCSVNSYPATKNKTCINISEGKNLQICTVAGNILDILLGLIYLLNKHKTACSILSTNFTENTSLYNFYKSAGVIINKSHEFMNFEMIWINQKLYLVDDFINKIKNCISNTKNKFIIIPLGIEMTEGSHANYIIYDLTKNIVERFEPHGSKILLGLNYNAKLLDDIIKSKFLLINKNITYLAPKDYLPKIGFQSMDYIDNKKKKIGDPSGFCALWVIWYVDMKLTYSDLDSKKLVKILIKNIRMNNISVKNMIRNYGINIMTIRDELLTKANLDINDWLNEQFDDIQLSNILDNIKLQIKKLN